MILGNGQGPKKQRGLGPNQPSVVGHGSNP